MDALTIILIVLGALFVLIFTIALIGAVIQNDKYPSSNFKSPFHFKTEEEQIKEFGDYGEEIVRDKFERALIGHEYYILNNFRINDNGRKIEVDLIIITKGGVFIIEIKSHKGKLISLNDGRFRLIKQEYQDDKLLNYNPSDQNERHIRILRSLMVQYPPKMISMIIFPFADISSIDDEKWFNIDDAIEFIIDKTNNGTYKDTFAKRIYEQLCELLDQYKVE